MRAGRFYILEVWPHSSGITLSRMRQPRCAASSSPHQIQALISMIAVRPMGIKARAVRWYGDLCRRWLKQELQTASGQPLDGPLRADGLGVLDGRA